MDTPVLVVGTVLDFPPTSEGELIARDIVSEFPRRPRKGYVLEMWYHILVASFNKLCQDKSWEGIPGTTAVIRCGDGAGVDLG
jgi:quinate dehydrogenase